MGKFLTLLEKRPMRSCPVTTMEKMLCASGFRCMEKPGGWEQTFDTGTHMVDACIDMKEGRLYIESVPKDGSAMGWDTDLIPENTLDNDDAETFKQWLDKKLEKWL